MADTDRRAGYSDIRMLTEFYKWYVTVIRESPLIVVAGSIVALFAAVGSVYAGVEAIAKFVRFLKARFFENRSLYRKLDKLNTYETVSMKRCRTPNSSIKCRYNVSNYKNA